MNPLPTGFLVLPARDTHDVRALRRKVRLIAARTLLMTEPTFEQSLRQEPEPMLDAIGSPDVLPLLLAGQVDAAIQNLKAPQAATFAITPSVHLSLTDSNPLQNVEEHPDKTGNAIDLGGRSVDEWIAGLREAFDLIHAALPEWYEELEVSLQRLIPVGYEPERHLSASYREAPGIAYLTLHPDPLTLAEAIIHETQHTKLNLLRWLDDVLTNGETCWTSSPVRPDLRPLIGVLMAVHAFVPVAALHQRLAEIDHPIASTSRFTERRAALLASNGRGFAILDAQAQPTAAGSRLLADLHALQSHLESMCSATAAHGGGDF
jgi:HEXXH motif-containing protein